VSRPKFLKSRAVLPLFAITSLKTILGLIIYSLPGKIAEPWNIYHAQTSSDGLYLFSAWDSGYYHSIAAQWYPSQLNPLWAYFPLYPSIMRLLGFAGVELWWAGVVVAIMSGLMSIVVFQKIAGLYLSPADAFRATILYFLLPPVFVFTTVSYTEPLFLLLSLLTWYSHMRGNETSAAVLAALTALTRSYGILIVAPIAYDLLRLRKYKSISLLALPCCTLVAWFAYAFNKTGVPLAPMVAESAWNTAIVFRIQGSIIRFFSSGGTEGLPMVLRYWGLIIVGAAFLALIGLLSIKVWKLDRTLGVYSLFFLSAFSAATAFFIPTFVSLPRYLSFSFAPGIALCIKRTLLFLALAVTLSVLDFLAWWLFLFSTVFH
jgi:hypothetical protein